MIAELHAFSRERTGALYLPDYMEWTKPSFSRAKVDAAGDVLRHLTLPEIPPESLVIIDNWRAAHYFPLNALQNVLRRRAKKIDRNAVIVQRIKRLSSIQGKLQLLPAMQFSRMQDIGGCRAVLNSADNVGKLALVYLKPRRPMKHQFVRVDDYINTPKPSGYRGVHLVYRYQGQKLSPFNGLRIEIQMRSKFQHAWATAVEIAGTFVGQALKSGQGEKEWLRFFALAGSAIALSEGCALVPDTPTDPAELKAELGRYADSLNVEEFLIGCGVGMDVPPPPKGFKAAYYLLQLDPVKQQTFTTAFREQDIETAFQEYFDAEKKHGVNVVLVSAQSVSALKRAYPNYFMDSVLFLILLNAFLGREGKVPQLTKLPKEKPK